MSVFMYGFVVRYMPNTPCGEIPGGSGPPTNKTSQLVGGLQEGTEYTFSVGLKFTYGGVGQWSLGAMATTYPDGRVEAMSYTNVDFSLPQSQPAPP